MRLVPVIISFVILFGLSARADTDTTKAKSDSTWTKATDIRSLPSGSLGDSLSKVDTLYYLPRVITSDAEQVSNPADFEDYLTQQPTIALFKSMLVPGWGQLGNRRYVKAGVIIGLEAWLLSNALHFGRLARNEKNRFSEESDPLLRDAYYRQYLDRRAQRNKYSWFLGIVVFASMFDAYVDAHLSGAPDQVNGTDLDLSVAPDLKGGLSASLSLSF